MRLRLVLLAALLAAAAVGSIFYFGYSETSSPHAEQSLWHCPMHPTYTADHAGECPICGMRLVPVKDAEKAEAAKSPAAEKKPLYQCPMHPSYTSEHPGECPICGMKLVPVKDDGGAEQHEAHAGQGGGVQGYATVKIPHNQQQMMGIVTQAVRRATLQKEIRTVGRVTYDETRVHHVHTRFEGYIDNIYANYVGQQVKSGEPLFSIYSPEVLATQNEYLLALKSSRKNAQSGALPGVDLVESAKRRLALWDIDERQIQELHSSGKAPGTVTIYSPMSGFVTAKTALQGMKISPDDVLYDIADLSTVWVIADVYENDLPFVHPGQEGRITTPYLPTRDWSAKVTFVYPNLDEKTRTVKTRLELRNPDFLLKPEMYASVLIKGDLGEGLVVPESAVLTTGQRKVVFISKEAGIFEPREVETGVRTQDYYEIKKGITEGENVVIGANFLLDSESRLKAAISGGHQH